MSNTDSPSNIQDPVNVWETQHMLPDFTGKTYLFSEAVKSDAAEQQNIWSHACGCNTHHFISLLLTRQSSGS